ncbi:MAG: hypothetical protein GWO02_15595, partial [Gammaproteobacteria bacterium]|nr:hypothetical protein [Gammaproteobacteria bacterium]
LTAAGDAANDNSLIFTVGEIANAAAQHDTVPGEFAALRGGIYFNAGCHGGLNVFDAFFDGGNTERAQDWAQFYSSARAILVGNT